MASKGGKNPESMVVSKKEVLAGRPYVRKGEV